MRMVYPIPNMIEIVKRKGFSLFYWLLQIDLNGIGRCKDNIIVERTWRTLKYEWVFLREYGSIEELEGSLGEFVEFFNSRRIHQGLDYMTPDEVYRQGTFPDAEEETKVA